MSTAYAPNEFNVTLTSANTEYSLALPKNTRRVQFQNRAAYDLRFAFTIGKVAVPMGVYQTLKNGNVYYEIELDTNAIVYFATAHAGDVVEVIAWT